MEISKGFIYGIGMGPGSPDYLTKRAADCIKAADILCLPQMPKDECRAYLIAREALPETAIKECLCFDFKMTRDAAELERIHSECYRKVFDLYKKGKKLAFLTIGDPSVYSTFSYIAKKARQDNLNLEIIPGVSSFCAAAANFGISLCEGNDPLHIISGQDIESILDYSGTTVILKCGRNIKKVKDLLSRMEQTEGTEVYAVSDCGLPEEKRYYGAAAIPDDGGYMTTIIIKRTGASACYQ